MKESAMPPDVELEYMARRGPEGFSLRHPGEPGARAVGLLHDVRDRVVRPEAERLEFCSLARDILCPHVSPRLLEAEAAIGQDGSVARLAPGPERHRPRWPDPHEVRPPGPEIQGHRGLVGDEVERRAHQMPIKDLGSRHACTADCLRQGDEMGLLPLVARQRSPVSTDHGPSRVNRSTKGVRRLP